MESIFRIVCSALSRRFWMPVLLAVAVPLARTQTSAPGIGVLGNRIVATTAGTLGLHSVTDGLARSQFLWFGIYLHDRQRLLGCSGGKPNDHQPHAG